MSAENTSAPQQYRQPSRKGKKAWRKHVDVSELEEGLENVRDQIIRGGVVAEKTSSELFEVDVVGDQIVKKKYEKTHKPLKIDEILSRRSAISAVDTRKRSNVGNGIIEPMSKRNKSGFVSHADLNRLKQRAYGIDTGEKDAVPLTTEAVYDPWAMDKEIKDTRFDFLEVKRSARAPRTIRDVPVSLLSNRKQLPAVVKPNGSASYNPVFQDWDEALAKEGNRELSLEHKRLEEARADEVRQAMIIAAENERDDLLTEDESAWEGFESDYDAPGIEGLNKRLPGRKTPVERNKIKRRKKAEQEARHIEAMKTRGQLTKKTREGEKQRSDGILADDTEVVPSGYHSSDEEIDDRALRRKRFGKYSVPEKSLEILLPDELPDSLRLLKPEGNLLKDRFRNLQIQGKLETRRPITQPKKRKVAVTEKWSYKDFTISA